MVPTHRQARGVFLAGNVQDATGEFQMHRTLLTRAVLVMVLGWGVGSGTAWAGGSDLYPRTPPGATELPPGLPAVDSSPSHRPLRDWIHHHRPLGCWSSFNGYSCSSLSSPSSFIFGSCRTFYGDPCLKGAPPSALPPWAGPESGYRTGTPGTAPAKAGCNCP